MAKKKLTKKRVSGKKAAAPKSYRKPGKASASMCELTTNPAKRAEANRLAASVKNALPAGLPQPALRALARAGYTSLAELAKVDDAELLKLHGFGPKGIKTIRAALGRKE